MRSSDLSRPWSCSILAVAADSGSDLRLSRGCCVKSRPFAFQCVDRASRLEPVDAADHFLDGAEAERRHDLAQLLGDEAHEVHDVLGLAGELLAQLRVLGRDAGRAGVQVADAHHDAAQSRPAARWRSRTPRRRASAAMTTSRPVFSWPSVSTAMRLRRLFSTSVWCVSARPSSQGRPACLMRGLRRGAGAAVVAADQHDVGVRLGDAGGDGADADLGHQLHADARIGGWRSSDRGSAPPGPRWSRCRGAAAAR